MIRALRLFGVNLLVFAAIVVVVEGLAGYASATRFAMLPRVDERRGTKYDPDLGWVSEPNFRLADMYGPGAGVRTNSRGFRNDHDFATTIPDGKIRVICSGDSFTFGEGVDNAHTWCQRLTALDHRLETINMGQRGYGVDQSYLWYKRDGMAFEHQVHVVAFITDDIFRAASDYYAGYRKPIIATEGGTLVVKGVPVKPRNTAILRFQEGLNVLHTTRVLNGLWTRLFSATSERTLPRPSLEDPTSRLMAKIIEDLQSRHDGVLMLVHLPTNGELSTLETTQPWTDFLRAQSDRLGVPFVDLFDDFRSLPADVALDLFLEEGEGFGHYSVKGNELVATLIYQELEKHLPPDTTTHGH